MKKITSKLILLMMMLVMTVGLVACGSSKQFSSISDYLSSDEIKSALSTMQTQLEGSGIQVDVKADGDKMVYTFTYDSVEKEDGMAEQLETQVSAQDATFQNVCDGIKEYVDVETACVKIEYIDCNGEEIYSKEYTSN